MNANALSGYIVGVRNKEAALTPYFTSDFKCRVFRHSLRVDLQSKATHNYVTNYNMTCPSGMVVQLSLLFHHVAQIYLGVAVSKSENVTRIMPKFQSPRF